MRTNRCVLSIPNSPDVETKPIPRIIAPVAKVDATSIDCELARLNLQR